MKYLWISLAAILTANLSATPIIITNDNAFSLGWYVAADSGGGSATITEDAPRSGSASMRLTGDAALYTQGNPNFAGPTTSYGLLSHLTGFGMDWRVDANTSNGLGANLSPSLHLHIIDPGADNILNNGDHRSELVWQFAENGGSGNVFGQWNTLLTNPISGTYFRVIDEYVGGVGNLGRSFSNPDATAQMNFTFAQWLAFAMTIYDDDSTLGSPLTQPPYSANAYIAAISVGVGSGFGPGYLAYVDNLVLNFASTGGTTFNFESVPEPATYGMVSAALLLSALWSRRSSRH